MRRFYFDTESSAPDSVCNDHFGNIRGARTIAQKVANELNEVVYINDCETDDIVESVYPNSFFDQSSEPVENSHVSKSKFIIDAIKIGRYELGRYHAIVKTGYSDGTFSYDTFFRSRKDLKYFISNHRKHLLELVFINDSDFPVTMTSISVIRGKGNIFAELNSLLLGGVEK